MLIRIDLCVKMPKVKRNKYSRFYPIFFPSNITYFFLIFRHFYFRIASNFCKLIELKQLNKYEENMAKNIYTEPSRTLMEYRLLPGLTTEESTLFKVSLRTPLVYSEKNPEKYHLNIPIVSAAMQSVSGVSMGIELAKLGSVAFIFSSQTTSQQAEMVNKIKKHKAGFVEPETVHPNMKIKELSELARKKGFYTFPVVNKNNVLLGIITKNDFDHVVHSDLKVS